MLPLGCAFELYSLYVKGILVEKPKMALPAIRHFQQQVKEKVINLYYCLLIIVFLKLQSNPILN
jgi:hypothetical protein